MSSQTQQQRDSALQPPTIITNPGREYSAASRLWQGIPGIEHDAKGRLWATWYSGGAGEGLGNYVLLVSSTDDGQSWSAPLLVIDPSGGVRAYDPVLWIDPSQTLWLFWAQGEGEKFDGRSGVWAMRQESSDKTGFAWSAPRRLCDGIMMNKPTVLSTGEWILPVTLWGYEQMNPTVTADAYAPHIVVSTDEGRTWQRRGSVEMADRAFDEHMIIERRDHSLWMLTRLRDGIGESTSHDKGYTWSPGRKTELTHPSSRFFIRRLQSGRILLVKHHAFTGRSHLTAFLSDDDGLTWRGGLLLDERAKVSYPDGVQAADGRIYIIYDRERLEAKEILMAVFTEEDVLAKAAVSSKARLKVLINKLEA